MSVQKTQLSQLSHSFGTPGQWDEETDVVVIGSGYAGLSAAVEACKVGASVIVLEKMPYFGGNSLISGGGYCSSDSKLKLREKLGLGEDSWQLHMKDTLEGGQNRNLPELVEVLARCAPEGLDFIIDAGVPFSDVLPRLGGHSAHRSYQITGSSGKTLFDVLLALARKSGAEVRNNSAVTRIWRPDAASKVSGVSVERDGVISNIRIRRALIVASGGFSRDVELRCEYDPLLTSAYNCSNHKGATGECIRYAQAVGADTVDMSYIQLFPTANPKNGILDKYALWAYSSTGFGSINVDKHGKRFVNELTGRDEVSNAQISSCDNPTYTILNKAIFAMLDVSQDDLKNMTVSSTVNGSPIAANGPSSTGIHESSSTADKSPATVHGSSGAADESPTTANGSHRIISAETVAELSDKLGMEYLIDTIAAHNGYIVNNQSDNEFNKSISPHMAPMLEGPYYAIPQWPSIHFCMGGLRFDTGAHVLDTQGAPIPRLYAAGECCGGVHGANRLAGNAITECIVFGRIAGANAAAEAIG